MSALARLLSELDAERRRIEEDLHDGVQQDLVATAVSLQLVAQLLESDPAAARALLNELVGQVEEALGRVRALAEGIYPSILLAGGLAAAVRSLPAARLDVDALGRYPLEFEEALYFSLRALLTPAARVRLWEDERTVRFELAVEDGMADSALSHARERIAAVGGQLEVSPGGMRVAASVPLPPSAR